MRTQAGSNIYLIATLVKQIVYMLCIVRQDDLICIPMADEYGHLSVRRCSCKPLRSTYLFGWRSPAGKNDAAAKTTGIAQGSTKRQCPTLTESPEHNPACQGGVFASAREISWLRYLSCAIPRDTSSSTISCIYKGGGCIQMCW